MSHSGVKHYSTMQAHGMRETWLDKAKRLFWRGNPAQDTGRKYIDPRLPYGHWAAGWNATAEAKRKER